VFRGQLGKAALAGKLRERERKRNRTCEGPETGGAQSLRAGTQRPEKQDLHQNGRWLKPRDFIPRPRGGYGRSKTGRSKYKERVWGAENGGFDEPWTATAGITRDLRCDPESGGIRRMAKWEQNRWLYCGVDGVLW